MSIIFARQSEKMNEMKEIINIMNEITSLKVLQELRCSIGHYENIYANKVYA